MTFNINGHQLPAFQACIACCDKITQAGYTLENNYADNFIVHNENSKENLFTIPMDKFEKGGDYTFFCSFPGHWSVMKGKLIFG